MTLPSLLQLRAKPARPRRGGFPTGAQKLSPGVAGRSSSASSELNRLLTPWVVDKTINLLKLKLNFFVMSQLRVVTSFPSSEEVRPGHSENWELTFVTAERTWDRHVVYIIYKYIIVGIEKNNISLMIVYSHECFTGDPLERKGQ